MIKLNDPTLMRQAALVGGQWIEADETDLAVTNPATGDVIGHVPNLGSDETRAAIAAAQTAQKSWAKRTAKDRARILCRWFDLMMEHQDDLGAILTAEQGKPLAEAKGEIAYGASFIEWFAEEARRTYGDVTPGHAPDKRIITIKQSIGVVAAITPWNFPNAMITRKAGPAFAAGCAMVLKPASQAPFSAIALAALGERAGLPAGLFSVITGSDRAIGAEMTGNPTVQKLTFTGSTEIGAMLYAQCAPTIKKLGLELGGNAPFIVFDDADLDAAVEGAAITKFRNNSQTCVCGNRIYVQAGVHDTFARKLAAKVAKHVADAASKGATVTLGGKAHALGGVKMSGLGREGSRYGLDDFMELKYPCMGGIDAPEEA
ncbi:aldehyde dehydrogenase family protein [Tropicibacter sp. Alg240-R139]|uniref:aldehyde dehydrogenase family protein n=1 Tax=Tropicibacter sp. Alg240-R139 TaxID=2305991 RepID=UPI001F07C1A0|nr:aldehyde dehydrogenase family protein [Tropicibacter sp. Alg240-R139]